MLDNTYSILKIDFITEEDCIEIYDLYGKWQYYREMKDYHQADIYRKRYKEWDESLESPEHWHPIFESLEHRRSRLLRNERMMREGMVEETHSLLSKSQKHIADFYGVLHC